MNTHEIVMGIDVIVIVAAIIELYKLIHNSNNGEFVDGSPWHTNQHVGILLGFIMYAISVIVTITIYGVEFSDEWLPTNILLNLVVVVSIWHFSLERRGK